MLYRWEEPGAAPGLGSESESTESYAGKATGLTHSTKKAGGDFLWSRNPTQSRLYVTNRASLLRAMATSPFEPRATATTPLRRLRQKGPDKSRSISHARDSHLVDMAVVSASGMPLCAIKHRDDDAVTTPGEPAIVCLYSCMSELTRLSATGPQREGRLCMRAHGWRLYSPISTDAHREASSTDVEIDTTSVPRIYMQGYHGASRSLPPTI